MAREHTPGLTMCACGPSTGEPKTGDCEFKTSLDNREKSCLKRDKKQQKKEFHFLILIHLQEINRPFLLGTTYQAEKFKDWHINAQPLTSNKGQ